jgi:hypothetical protein
MRGVEFETGNCSGCKWLSEAYDGRGVQRHHVFGKRRTRSKHILAKLACSMRMRLHPTNYHPRSRFHLRSCFCPQDLLRDLLLNEETENYELFSEEDEKQFIFRIFKWLAVGGSMNQPDEKIDNYLQMTKTLYR